MDPCQALSRDSCAPNAFDLLGPSNIFQLSSGRWNFWKIGCKSLGGRKGGRRGGRREEGGVHELERGDFDRV